MFCLYYQTRSSVLYVPRRAYVVVPLQLMPTSIFAERLQVGVHDSVVNIESSSGFLNGLSTLFAGKLILD